MAKFVNITLDGPGGSGKSTIAKSVAKKLGFLYVDTGAMYRAVAYYMISNGININDEKCIEDNLSKVNLDLDIVDGVQKVYLNGKDVAGEIRTQEVSLATSTVSKNKKVRFKMVELQREMANSHNSVFDGRDMGSIVLPDADYKFYVTADINERAKRRYLELKGKSDVTLEQVKAEMITRDEQDSNRAVAPLVIPQGAFVVDTTNLTISEVEDLILSRINK